MEYRIEQLARAAGVAVDTIRFYQGKGLLEAPRREGRVTFYGDGHVERLKRIKELQQQGFTLTVIQRFLAGELEASDEALVAAVTHPAAPQTLTLGELAERSGVAEPLLASLEQAGLLVPITGGEEPPYPADDLEAIAAGVKPISARVPLGALLGLGKDHAAPGGRAARQAGGAWPRSDALPTSPRPRAASRGKTSRAGRWRRRGTTAAAAFSRRPACGGVWRRPKARSPSVASRTGRIAIQAARGPGFPRC